jgi:hypothetical protein
MGVESAAKGGCMKSFFTVPLFDGFMRRITLETDWKNDQNLG